jgi:peptidoglycan/xylan/chitin deacetylase (PgdA/CDA1 family)
MARRRGTRGAALVVGLVVAATALTAFPAQAAPPPVSPPTPGAAVPGPPRSQVLAVDPATVPVPEVVTSAAATSCPPVTAGIRNSAPGSGKTVALTFDDGPGASTAAILAILRDANVTATFFNVGVNAAVRPDLVVAEAQQGFLLGNHTWSHPNLTTLPPAGQAQEMDRATTQQISLVGSRPCFFRPPYGAYNSTTLNLAQARGMAAYNWSVDTEDWKARGSASSFWVDRIIRLAQAGGSQMHPVVLMHNQPGAMPATVAALPSIIAFYRDRGYTFVDLAGRVAGGDRLVSGDWDGNGTTTPGVVRGNTWYLRNSNSPGPADVVFVYGAPTDRPVTGDWDGNGTTTPGVVRGNTWKLRNSNSGGFPSLEFVYGATTDRAVTGDWDRNRTTTPGVVRGTTWKLRNSNSGGFPDLEFVYDVATSGTIAQPP